MSILKNVRLAITTIADHLTEAPFVLALQILRRLPSTIVRPAASGLASLAPQSSGAAFLLASHAAGDDAGLERRFENALRCGTTPEHARKAAEVALAAGRTEWADRFLSRATESTQLAATTARRRWYDGDMTSAVDVLRGQPGNASKQRQRLESELRVFQGWRPSLASTSMQPEPRRVLHLLTNSVPHTGSGYARRSHSILSAQAREGWEPLAVTRLGYPVQIGVLNARDVDVVDGVRYQRLLPAAMVKSMDGRLQQQAEELLQVAREFRPSVLHTTTHFVNGLVAREVAHALGIPWVYEVRGQLADTWASTRDPEAKSSERYRLFTDREADVMRSADLVVTLGESMKRNILAAGVPEERILLSPNAVGGAYLGEPLTHAEARSALGLESDALYIGTVSSLVDYEGLEDLVTSFALLAPRLPKLKLIVVGDGTAAPALRDQVRRLGLLNSVLFPGRVPADKAQLFHQALDVFVVPRKDLSVTRSVTPLKPVEALASARPVVASRLDALQEIVHDGVNGRLAEPSDPEGLAEVLLGLLEDNGMRRRLGDAGRQQVLATRTWEANAKACVQAYETLASNYTRRAS
ncbi:MAG: glycosyltransferase [Paenarthrobacter ureafaciens]|uniref:glycosyltransferase family 4 protein n=1 Tax=Paenarthrobacter ureafaciens TaxID=37931 RepID=UPI001ACDADCF|nr:glycosyltransferase family 4 protein [Paenarthrobacter ureafaciens]MBN9130315.1 glycosyltransferase [Paenarthrobacter ureafaciens]